MPLKTRNRSKKGGRVVPPCKLPYLPLELTEHIAEYLLPAEAPHEDGDLLTLRLVCTVVQRATRPLFARTFFCRRSLTFTEENFERLRGIAQIHDLAEKVTTLEVVCGDDDEDEDEQPQTATLDDPVVATALSTASDVMRCTQALRKFTNLATIKFTNMTFAESLRQAPDRHEDMRYIIITKRFATTLCSLVLCENKITELTYEGRRISCLGVSNCDALREFSKTNPSLNRLDLALFPHNVGEYTNGPATNPGLAAKCKALANQSRQAVEPAANLLALQLYCQDTSSSWDAFHDLSHVTLPRLRDFRLHLGSVQTRDVYRFLRAHEQTLRTLQFHVVDFDDGLDAFRRLLVLLRDELRLENFVLHEPVIDGEYAVFPGLDFFDDFDLYGEPGWVYVTRMRGLRFNGQLEFDSGMIKAVQRLEFED